MTFLGLFENRATIEAADRLIAAVSAVARRPELFGPTGVPDSLDGRFEMIALYAGEAIRRLGAAPASARLSQVFVDRLFRHLDAGLREAGIGDLTVPKRMKALAKAFYGRFEAYGGAADEGALATALARNIWNLDDATPAARTLAAHVLNVRSALGQVPETQIEVQASWPEPPQL